MKRNLGRLSSYKSSAVHAIYGVTGILLWTLIQDKLIANASKSDILEASKLENESKFSKLTWIKLFQKYIHHPGDSSDSDSDSDD